MKYCDLHTHSTFSDGTLTPTEIVELAEELGLTAVALTDHNNVDGLAELLAGPLSDAEMISTIEALAASIRDEMPLEKARWGGSTDQWEKMVDQLQDYCDGHAVRMINNLCSCIGLDAQAKQAYFGDLLNIYHTA